jgi:dienelactone hydrolase
LADSAGVVDLARAAPIHGPYTQADPMGLFWAMMPTSPNQTTANNAGRNPVAPLAVTLTAEAAGRRLAEARIERLFYDEAQVTRQPVREAGLVATLFLPKAAGPHPAVICLSGSEGGLVEGYAALLASHGFVALALGYFGVEPLPAQLVEIPLESLKAGIDWLKARPEVDGTRIALLGGSKGAELALLLAATYSDDIRGGVVAYQPSAVVWMGLPANPADNFRGPKSSWTRDGRPMPFVSGGFTFDLIKPMLRQPAALLSSYQAGLKNAQAVAAATIPVEQMRGPVLLVSGRRDQLWPSTTMAEMVMRRLDAHSFPYRHEHLAYADAGHGLSLPHLPTTTINRGSILMGGTPQATAAANADAWAKVVAFLAAHGR